MFRTQVVGHTVVAAGQLRASAEAVEDVQDGVAVLRQVDPVGRLVAVEGCVREGRSIYPVRLDLDGAGGGLYDVLLLREKRSLRPELEKLAAGATLFLVSGVAFRQRARAHQWTEADPAKCVRSADVGGT